MLDARLRAGNVGAADGALDVILDVVDRARKTFCDMDMVRIDAGFPSATLLAGLDARGIDYVSRLRANPVLDRLAEPFMKRPPGRRPAEPRTWLYELRYQADRWDKPRRVILVVKERADDLLLDRFFLVTSLGWTAKTRGGEGDGQPVTKIMIQLADGKARSIQYIATTTYWGPDGRPLSAAEFLTRLFGDLSGMVANEDQLRKT